jgi:hypothetical protein
MKEHEELLSLRQVVPSEMWNEHQDGMRESFDRMLGLELIRWLREHGPAIVSRVEELAVVSSEFIGQTEVRSRITVLPIGPLVQGEFYFRGGPLDGERIATDGGPYWRIPIAGQPQKIRQMGDVPKMLIADYERRGYIYHFVGYER